MAFRFDPDIRPRPDARPPRDPKPEPKPAPDQKPKPEKSKPIKETPAEEPVPRLTIDDIARTVGRSPKAVPEYVAPETTPIAAASIQQPYGTMEPAANGPSVQKPEQRQHGPGFAELTDMVGLPTNLAPGLVPGEMVDTTTGQVFDVPDEPVEAVEPQSAPPSEPEPMHEPEPQKPIRMTQAEIKKEATARAMAKNGGKQPTQRELNEETSKIAKEIRTANRARQKTAARQKQSKRTDSAKQRKQGSSFESTVKEIEKMEDAEIVNTISAVIDRMIARTVSPEQAIKSAKTGRELIGHHPVFSAMTGYGLGMQGDQRNAIGWLTRAVIEMHTQEGSRKLFLALSDRLSYESSRDLLGGLNESMYANNSDANVDMLDRAGQETMIRVSDGDGEAQGAVEEIAPAIAQQTTAPGQSEENGPDRSVPSDVVETDVADETIGATQPSAGAGGIDRIGQILSDGAVAAPEARGTGTMADPGTDIEPDVIETAEEAEWLVDEIVSQPELDKETEAELAKEVLAEAGVPGGDDPPGEDFRRDDPGGFDEPIERGPAYSSAYQRVVDARAWISHAYDVGIFHLSGDHKVPVPRIEDGKVVKDKRGNVKMTKKNAHSKEVQDKLEEAFGFFGRKYDENDEIFFFRAFQLYRGFSPDRNNLIFNKKPETVSIKDSEFIEFLDEIMENTRRLNHPFAYTNPRASLGGTPCYPLPTTRDVAEFFTKVLPREGNNLKLSTNAFIEYSMNEWTRDQGVQHALMSNENISQQEAVIDFIDVIAESWGGDSRVAGSIQARSVNSRLSADEMWRLNSAYATEANLPEEIKLLLQEQHREAIRARAYTEKIDKRLPKKRKRTKRKKTVTVDGHRFEVSEDVSYLDDLFSNPPDGKTVIAAINTWARTSQVAAMPVLAVTGVLEHGVGVFNQWTGQKWLNSLSGVKSEATPEMLDLITRDDFLYGLDQVTGIMTSKGSLALRNAADRGVLFTHKTEQARSEKVREFLMKLSIGDVAFRKNVSHVFIQHLVYQFERSYKLAEKNRARDLAAGRTPKPIIKVTPEQLTAMMKTNPDAFWRLVAQTKEGRAAVHYAANTSLNGIDPLTMSLRKATMDPVSDFALGFLGGFFLKYAIRSMLRRIPMSLSMLYIAKRGISDNMKLLSAKGLETIGMEGMVERAIESNADSNELLLGGNEDFFDGLGQTLIVDLARARTQTAVLALVAAVIYALGGIQPPDDDDLRHLWYEWKIGDRAIKTAWYWTELLGGTMPLAMSLYIVFQEGDVDSAKEVLGHGLASDLEDNAWLNVADTIDLLTNYDYHLAEAQARSEGYMGENPVSPEEYGTTMIKTFIGRRLYSSFEPALIRAIWNEAGTDAGRQTLAHSTNVVYTEDPDDDEPGKLPRTTLTSWSDAQMRKMAYPSPTAGLIMNLIGGYFIDNDEIQRTGYWKHQMPLITNADPYQVEMMNDLVVLDENGEQVPYDKWTDAQKRSIGNQVIEWAKTYTPSQLAANGVVIPYDARMTARELLDEQWVALEDHYHDRVESGEFWSSYNGLSYEENYILKGEAWEEKDAAQKELEALVDTIWSDDIPYSPTVYNRWETTFRPLYVWREGTEKAGQPATKWDWRLNKDDVEISVYASGDHRSSFWPFGIVDDQGENTYNAETKLAWQTKDTDLEFVRRFAEGNEIAKGLNSGQDLWSVIGPGVSKEGGWDNGKLVMGVRAYVPAQMPYQKVDPEDKWLGKDYEKSEPNDPAKKTSNWGSRWGGSWGGSGGYAPNIYSHPAYSLRTDKPAGLYSKVPYEARFDYLRPSFTTKGSREAYRREDF